MDISDVSCESMEVDKSSNSVKSANDSISDYLNKVNIKNESSNIDTPHQKPSFDDKMTHQPSVGITRLNKTLIYDENAKKATVSNTPEIKTTRSETTKNWFFKRSRIRSKEAAKCTNSRETSVGISVTGYSPIQDILPEETMITRKIIPEMKGKSKTIIKYYKSRVTTKEGIINTSNSPMKLKTKKFEFRGAFIISATIAICIALIMYHLVNLKCMEHIQMSKLDVTLNENIFGQNIAIRELISTLDMQSTTKVLFLYGGIGVGKTYAVSLVMNDLWDYSNIYHYTMPTFRENFSSDLLLGLILCKSTILIVDGLSSEDMDVHIPVQEMINKSRDLNRITTIILIYNCDTVNSNFKRGCDNIFLNTLQHSFKEVNVLKQFIKFEPLREEHLRKCIQAEIGHQIPELKMQEYLKNFDVASDGCKGVPNKVKFLNIM